MVGTSRSSPHPTTRRRVGLFEAFVGAVAVLAVLEVSVRVVATFGLLPEPLGWYSVEAQRQADDLAVLAELDAQSQLVFVGTSMVGEAIDTATFEQTCPALGQVQNLALDGAQTPVVERWLEDEVRPTLEPMKVVWGISSLDLNGNRAVPVLQQYEAASATRSGAMGGVIRQVEKWSVAYRYRSFFRDPAAFVAGKTSVVPEAPRGFDELGNYPLGPEVAFKTERERARIATEVLTRFDVGPIEMAALVGELGRLRADGVQVLVVLMPVPPSYIELHPGGQADFDEFLEEASAAVTKAGVPIVDAHDWFAESDFRDHAHLRRTPAKAFTRRLATDSAICRC